ncbi:MAG: serine/threonine protein kinase [Anaerolineae bacterium]|nr:serine/threonine protein kinase [Anaerolineae bacterium]
MTNGSMLYQQIDEYQLQEKLGEGGMAAVYRALDVRLNRYVALKVIHTSLRADSEYSRRFEREAQAIAQLEHPNIIRLYRYGEKDGLLYMAMQYVDGADLAAIIRSFKNEYIDFPDIIRLTHEIAAALDYAHARGVIHRDIKPHNIMVSRDGRAFVADFGLALMTEIGTLGETFGSPHYIAPEQAISSAGAVPQSDLYALGVVIYEMLTGHVPYDASDLLDIAMMHMNAPIPSPRAYRPELTPAVENVLIKALAKEPSARYAVGKELATALENALQTGTRPGRMSIINNVALESLSNPLPPVDTANGDATYRHQAAPTVEANMASRTLRAAGRTVPKWILLGSVIIVLLLLGLISVAIINSGSSNTSQPTNSNANLQNQTTTEVVATSVVTEMPLVNNETTIPPTPTNLIQASPTFPPESLQTTIQLLENGIGLTTGQLVTTGNFEVEGYCKLLNIDYDVTEDRTNWYCTDNGAIIRTLTITDFIDICRRTYNNEDAIAVQIDGTEPIAYRWRCAALILVTPVAPE